MKALPPSAPGPAPGAACAIFGVRHAGGVRLAVQVSTVRGEDAFGFAQAVVERLRGQPGTRYESYEVRPIPPDRPGLVPESFWQRGEPDATA